MIGMASASPHFDGDSAELGPIASSSLASSSHAESSGRAAAACKACRDRKIRCSGEKPTCQNCQKKVRTCVYLARVPKKRREFFTRPRRASTSHEERPPIPAGSSAPSQVQDTPSTTADDSRRESGMSFDEPFLDTGQSSQLLAQPTAVRRNDDIFNLLLGLGNIGNNGSQVEDPFAFVNLSTPKAWLEQLGGADSSAMAFGPSPPSDQSVIPNGLNGQFLTSDPVMTLRRQVSRLKRLQVPFFRFFGPTAILPGYKQVTSVISRAPSPLQDIPATPPVFATFSPAPYEDHPSNEAMNHLIPLFISHFNYFFSFINLRADIDDPSRYSLSPALTNIVCALAARFSPMFENNADNALREGSRAWAEKAKSLVSRDLAISTTDLMDSLILLSWYEFGGDRDGGLWMYSGMAFRMGQDLGLETIGKEGGALISGTTVHDRDMASSRRRHCCLRVMDSIMTIGTGRRGMFQDRKWTVPNLPSVMTHTGQHLPDPFEHVTQIFVYVDQIAHILVNVSLDQADKELAQLQNDLTAFYSTLPEDLKFSTLTFQSFANAGQGGAFVLLHTWFHALVLLSYLPLPLLSSSDLSRHAKMDDAGRELAVSSAKSIMDIVAFAEIIDNRAVTQPWINYPLYLAARTFLLQARRYEDPECTSVGKEHMIRAARQDFQKTLAMLGKVEIYWTGVRYIRQSLEQRENDAEVPSGT
ncbi:hypothetical protein BD324DRAFT_630881 [Kockovaella imperatae]|uniref:Zn(2)-C6 fungal-type domain-containing protein n=1 Tax=Kockovaella imperatae TaxID=4999 RepID=A0A1Y1UEX9_9TREE|nr:hypothetical protein BD324DRAFT_630881 [Kockovaella imperatae]ORX35625.1 hypothetical protein BD324DRAFT_630881 [Kockovaella imperatae]